MEGVRAEALGQTKLAFDDLVNEFNAAQNTPGVEEALETKHWSHAAFLPSGDLVRRRCWLKNNFREGRFDGIDEPFSCSIAFWISVNLLMMLKRIVNSLRASHSRHHASSPGKS